jgi:ankyrin repeat protein
MKVGLYDKSFFALLIFCLGFAPGLKLFAQQKNELLDRDFWKSQPSIDQVKFKIEEGHSPTAMTRFNFDPTGYAILENNPIETIQFLMEQGNDVNKLTHDARTYIFWAAYKGNLELMKHLVDRGANTDLLDQHGYSIMMFAAATGQPNTAIYDYCIELGADIINERTRDGRNALLAHAASMKSIDALDYFVSKGLDIHSTDPDGNGVFYHAAKTGNLEFLKTLISKYKVSYDKNPSTNENAILSASARFSRSGDQNPLSFYQYLEGLGLNPAIVSNDGSTALINLAYQGSDMEVFRYFIEKGVNPEQVNDEGNNSLIIASIRNSPKVVEFFLEATENVNHTNEKGESALSKAIKSNDYEIAERLIAKGASTKVLDKEGHDLGYQILDGYQGNIQDFKKRFALLTENGYDPKSKQADGSTLLHLAVKSHDVKLLEYLVANGVDINIKDHEGQSALHVAAMLAKNSEMLEYLIDAGADKTVLTDFDESAYDLATQNELLASNKANIEFLKF